jgi:hypothetical protein
MECVSVQAESCGIYRSLLDNIDAVGIEVLFSLDILRQNRESGGANPLFDRLEEMTVSCPLLLLEVLPHILILFVRSTKRHRLALYPQGSNRGTEGFADRMAFFASCHSLLNRTVALEKTWSTRLALLSIVEKESLFSTTQRDNEESLKQVAELAIAALDHLWQRESS